jgi:hypothetical protein
MIFAKKPLAKLQKKSQYFLLTVFAKQKSLAKLQKNNNLQQPLLTVLS